MVNLDERGGLVDYRNNWCASQIARNATSGNLPPYRFAYLIDRAKQHAATVQAFGAALLSALEKKDAEPGEDNLESMITRVVTIRKVEGA